MCPTLGYQSTDIGFNWDHQYCTWSADLFTKQSALNMRCLTITCVLLGLLLGVAYASPMPAFGDILSNKDIAAVVNHERTQWGNSAPLTSADEVQARR